ncbi:MAG: glycerol-3-phosphate 1-O-acyltransferase PlsY [Hyphomicrobiaceae bacterium]
MWPWLIYGLIIGYLFGSIPFGLVLSQAAGLGDIRNIGSGNIGATNVLRTGNKGLAAATLLLDGLKATVAVLLVNHWYGQVPAHMAALGAFLGHVYPVWLRFKGGKGVATFVGSLFGLCWQAGVAFCAIWLIMAYAMRFSSLAAIAASIASPIVLLMMGRPVTAALFAILTLLLLWKHRDNIGRLRRGTEPRIGDKSSSAVPNEAT